MIQELKIYKSDSIDPYHNLATEKILLDTVSDDCCILYLWQNKNTVVIGRNQNPWLECGCKLLELEGGKLARRLSGGGAVYHDMGNLNFTFICSNENYDLKKQLSVIKKACSYTGINAEFSGRNDIMINDKKFSGNAFYNSQGKSYHHGTLLVSADMEKLQRYLTPPKAKLEAKGIKSTRSRVINLSDLSPNLTCNKMAEYMSEAFEEVYKNKSNSNIIIDKEKQFELSEKYSSWEYLYGTPMPFTFSCEDHFAWGNISIQFLVKNGIIKSVKVYSDSMDWTLPGLIEKSLIGVKFTSIDLIKILDINLPQDVSSDIISIINKAEI